MIEVDVHVLRSGEVMVFHDSYVDRTTNGHGSLKVLSFEELRRLDAGHGQQVPTLEEIIECIAKKVPLAIELKGPKTAEPVAAILKRYLKIGFEPDNFLVASFNHGRLAEFKTLLPAVKTAVIFRKLPADFIEQAKRLGVATINPRADKVTAEVVRQARQDGFELVAWTVNDPGEARRLKVLGIKGVFSNVPDVIRAAIA